MNDESSSVDTDNEHCLKPARIIKLMQPLHATMGYILELKRMHFMCLAQLQKKTYQNRVTNDPQTSFSRFIFQVDPSINHPPIQVHYWVYCMIHNKHTQQTAPFRHFVGDATDG